MKLNDIIIGQKIVNMITRKIYMVEDIGSCLSSGKYLVLCMADNHWSFLSNLGEALKYYEECP